MIVIINLDTHHWLALIGAALILCGITALIVWPFARLAGYEQRGRERPERRPDLEWMKIYREGD